MGVSSAGEGHHHHVHAQSAPSRVGGHSHVEDVPNWARRRAAVGHRIVKIAENIV